MNALRHCSGQALVAIAIDRCALCPAGAPRPAAGVPDGWSGFYRNDRGWTLVCGACAARVMTLADQPEEMEMDENGQQLLDLLCANYERGLIFAGSARLPGRFGKQLQALRYRGLVQFDRYVPAASAMLDWQAKRASAAAAATTILPAPAKRSGGQKSARSFWSAERKNAFVAALAEGAIIKEALVAIGLSAKTKGNAYRERRADAAFAARWDEAVRRCRPAVPPAEPVVELQEIAAPALPVAPVEPSPIEGKPKAASPRELAQREEEVLGMLVEAAEAGVRCPTNRAIADALGRGDDGGASAAIQTLERLGYVAVERHHHARRVTILASGKATAAVVAGESQEQKTAGSGPAKSEPVIDVAAALAIQRGRAARAKLAEGLRLTSSNQGAHRFHAQRLADQQQAEADRLGDPVEQAKIALQRKGRVVYKMSVQGGDPNLYFCSGLGADVTGEQLRAEAARGRQAA